MLHATYASYASLAGALPKMAAALCAYRGQRVFTTGSRFRVCARRSRAVTDGCRPLATFSPALLFWKGSDAVAGCLRSVENHLTSRLRRHLPIGRSHMCLGDINRFRWAKNNAHRGRRMRWASFIVIDDLGGGASSIDRSALGGGVCGSEYRVGISIPRLSPICIGPARHRRVYCPINSMTF